MSRPDFIYNEDELKGAASRQTMPEPEQEELQEEPQEEQEEPQKPQERTLAETLEIPNPSAIFPHIAPCTDLPSKFHHFRFRHAADQKKMEQALRTIDPSYELVQNVRNSDNVDMTIMNRGATVGKIQFLHFDRRDRGTPSKYYVKLYFYQFQNAALLQQVMEVVKGFFMSLRHKRHQKRNQTHKKRNIKKRGVTRKN